MKCQSLLLTAPRHLSWNVTDLPEPQGHEVLIQTQVGAISIGSEVPQYTGVARGAIPPHLPDDDRI